MDPVFLNKYELKNNIQTFGIGELFVAVHKKTNLEVVVKMISKSCTKELEMIYNEIEILKKLDHPFIMHIFEIIDTEDYIFMIMEYCQNGTLLAAIKDRGPFNEEDASMAFAQLMLANSYLVNFAHVLHRDIKAENIVFDAHRNVRLSEFGISKAFEKSPLMKTQCGSENYSSPEIYAGKQYTAASDIWSFGVVLFAMTVGYLPFYDKEFSKLAHKIMYLDPDIPNFLSPQLVDLLKKMLMKNPADRIRIKDILAHPWLSKNVEKIKSKLRNIDIKPETIYRSLDLYGYDVEKVRIEVEAKEATSNTAAYKMLHAMYVSNYISHVNLKSASYSSIACPQLPRLIIKKSYTNSVDFIAKKHIFRPSVRKTNSILV